MHVKMYATRGVTFIYVSWCMYIYLCSHTHTYVHMCDRVRAASTSIVLQEAPQLTTPSVFSSNDQPPTPHSPTTMLQFRCRRHPCRPYCCQQAQCPTSSCALLTLPRTSSLALLQQPCPSCLILIFGRLSFADHCRAIFSSGDFRTFLGRLQNGLTFGRPLSEPTHFL